MVEKEAFVYAHELSVADTLSLSGGRIACVTRIEIECASPGKSFTTFNFEVAETHTYFVGDAGVWVHNISNFACKELAGEFLDLVNNPNGATSVDNALQHVLSRLDDMEEAGDISKGSKLLHFDHIVEEVAEHALKRKYPGMSDEMASFLAKNRRNLPRAYNDGGLDAGDLAKIREELGDTRGAVNRTTAHGHDNLEGHHLFPQELEDEFRDIFGNGYNQEDFNVGIDELTHRGRGSGLHNRVMDDWIDRGDWNQAWRHWLDQNPNATPAQTMERLEWMINAYGIPR